MKLPRKPASSIALLFLAGLMLAPQIVRLIAGRRNDWGQRTVATARHPMRPFTVTQLDGRPWRLDDHRGQVVLLNFWATWCPPCRRELPGLAALHRSHSAATLAILGISLDHTGPQAVRDFATEFGLPFPIALADSGWQLDQIPTGIPSSILLDRQGRVAKTYPGPASEAEFQADIDALLREPPIASAPAIAAR
ncbi:MAG TPA: TlpA disulfide reductase family protein [Acidobacteriaceae bacterium]|jgi:peroxiredoxin|nr:TlpA disulfide reductase family protein [Acidobacteriaceae bacterium]